MQQQNWWEQDAVVSQDAAPGIIRGRPKAPDPLELQRLDLSRQSNDRANAAADRAATAAERQAATAERQAGQQVFSNAQNLATDFNSNNAVKGYRDSLPMYAAALQSGDNAQGDQLLITAYAKLTDPTTGVREGESQAIANTSPYAQQLMQTLSRQVDPNTGLLPDGARANLRNELHKLMGERNRAYIQLRGDYRKRAELAGVDPRLVIGEHAGGAYQAVESGYLGRPVKQMGSDGKPFIPGVRPQGPEGEFTFNDQLPETTTGNRLSPAQEAAYKTLAQSGGTAQELEQLLSGFGIQQDDPARASLAEVAKFYADPANRGRDAAIDYSRSDEGYKAQLREQQLKDAQSIGGDRRDDSLVLGQTGLSQGLLDEGKGIGGAIGAIFQGRDPIAGYRTARDSERLRAEDARARSGALGTVAEVGSSMFLPLGTLAGGVRSATKLGAMGGALAGFGYGEGAQSVPNALTGAVVGGTIGKGFEVAGRGVNALLSDPARQAGRVARDAELAAARDVASAADAEGVRVSRGILDPRSRNSVVALETTRGGAAAVQRGLGNATDDIEAGVSRIGGGGTKLSTDDAGAVVQEAGKRFIDVSGKRATLMYNRAKAFAGFVGNRRVQPTDALATINRNIAELEANGPRANAELINYMKRVKGDLMQAGGLPIDAVRSMRTQMRGQIDQAGLTKTDAERRMSQVIDSASQDIERTLAKSEPALRAYREADAFYRDRMTYIDDIVQRFTGTRDKPLAAEKAFANLQSMMQNRGDARRLGEMMKSLAPEERADITTTFASALGRNGAGEFSPAMLVTQAEKMTPRAKLTAFGPDGARSLDNLVKIAREVRDVKLNNSRTGVTRNYRSWLASVLGIVGGGVGAVAGTAAGGAGGGVLGSAIVGSAAAKATRAIENVADAHSAKVLMDPAVNKWLATAPRTVAPAEIDAHFKKLTSIASRNPAIAQEISKLQQALLAAANDNVSTVTRAAASDGTEPQSNN